jgi:hypothetical protein
MTRSIHCCKLMLVLTLACWLGPAAVARGEILSPLPPETTIEPSGEGMEDDPPLEVPPPESEPIEKPDCELVPVEVDGVIVWECRLLPDPAYSDDEVIIYPLPPESTEEGGEIWTLGAPPVDLEESDLVYLAFNSQPAYNPEPDSLLLAGLGGLGLVGLLWRRRANSE